MGGLERAGRWGYLGPFVPPSLTKGTNTFSFPYEDLDIGWYEKVQESLKIQKKLPNL